ncbi:hypothetical protein MSAN_00704700 [Mycena sanguinolenta]|uniref:DUF914-domain-containing protein n=1 Tax=Mycena sanguinolenta TaxID=230812 RepID=A0A8H6Z7M1_9AGAR|nr:hypothetical protein MSAN_00704700 [Mycena sanguinolenta]
MESSDDHKSQLPEVDVAGSFIDDDVAPVPSRPPIEYTSVSAFFSSSGRRFKSLWTRRFTLSLLAGQARPPAPIGTLFDSGAACFTKLGLAYDSERLPVRLIPSRELGLTSRTSSYFSLFAVYTPYTMYRYGFLGWCKMIFKDGWKYIILAACDVEGNFMVVKAYQYTDLLSCMLLDAWAIPVCMFFSYIYMRPRYHWTQILGVFICILGLGLLVGSDELTQKDWVAAAKGKGDAFMVAGATLYGFSVECYRGVFRAESGLFTKVVGQLGMWGTIICGIQAAGLEHDAMHTATWNGATVGILLAYTSGKSLLIYPCSFADDNLAMFILYTVAPMLYRMASSAYYNLSLLSSDWYGLIFGLGLYHYKPYWLYFIAFALVLSGLITYFWHSTPEEQGETDPKAPDYLEPRNVRSEPAVCNVRPGWI